MKTAKRNQTSNVHSRFNEAQITVRPGEPFSAETELCTGDWLHSLDDQWHPDKANALNPTVCVAVEGAKPGDVLAVRILDIEPDSIGYTGFIWEQNALARRIADRELTQTVKTVAIRDGLVRWSPRLNLPVRPMIGTLGTAPAEEILSNAKGGRHGGNMDVQEVEAGNTVYLPVSVPGALLHIGDVHAIQGDGEINISGGIECRSVVTLSVDIIRKPEGMGWPRIENEEWIMTVACCESAEASFQEAAGELIRWITDISDCPEGEAYLLMGQVMEARCTQFVNPTRSYICKIAKRYL